MPSPPPPPSPLPVAWPSPTSTQAPALPIDPTTGMLIPISADDLKLLGIKRRGMPHDHVRWNLGPDGAGCVRKFSCAWGYRWRAMMYFVGAATTYNTSGGDTGISRLVPLADPDFPNWICTRVEIEPYQFTAHIDGTNGVTPSGAQALPIYDRCDFTATFEMVPFSVATDAQVGATPSTVGNEQNRYVTQPGLPGCGMTTEPNFITMPGSILNFVTSAGGTVAPAGSQIPYSIGRTETYENFKVIFRRVPFSGWGGGSELQNRVIGSEIERGYQGAVNLTTFLGYPPLTLQLRGVEANALPDPTGLGYSWDIVYNFSQKPVPYGHFGFFYGDPTSGGKSGYYQTLSAAAAASTGNKPLAANLIGDDQGLFLVREFADLFAVGLGSS